MKNIRTEMLKNSIAEYTDIANSIKENTSEIINSMLREAVANEYVKIMSEDFDKDEDEEEYETDVEETTDDDNTEAEDTESVETDIETDDNIEGEESETSVEIDSDVEEADDSTPSDMSEFDDYKVDGTDDQYDFSTADDETLVKVYKLLDNSDEVVVKMDKENNRLGLKTNDTEYIIELDPSCDEEECDTDDFNNGINESRNMIEILLTENGNLGYTTNYQKSDVMTTPSMKEPGKNVNDWDAGVPKGKKKPWPGNPKSKSAPYGKTVNEDEMEECGGEDMMEGANVPTKNIPKWGTNGSGKADNSDKISDYGVNQKPKQSKNISDWGTKKLSEDMDVEDGDDLEETNLSVTRRDGTHAVHNRIPAALSDEFQRDGLQKTSKGTTYRANGKGNPTNESMSRKHAQIMKENKIMKQQLTKLMDMVNEAAVTNLSLGNIVKLFNENATTQDEKKEIYSRFNDVKTIEESKKLYKTISQELSKKSKMNINEDKQFGTSNQSQINENVIHMTKDLMNSLDLMHKICK